MPDLRDIVDEGGNIDGLSDCCQSRRAWAWSFESSGEEIMKMMKMIMVGRGRVK